MVNKGSYIKRYLDEDYFIYFNKESGVLIRQGITNDCTPFYSKHGPELLDISITNYCERGCSFCYRKSNKNGKHISLNDYKYILREAKKCDVVQVALGGGNPNQHPQFEQILQLTAEEGIIPSYTTNGDGLTEKIIDATKKYCGAVAVSLYKPYTSSFYTVEKFIEAGIKTNVHFMLNSSTINDAIDIMRNIPKQLQGVNAIIFLNYKPQNNDESLLLKNSTQYKEFFELINTVNWPFKIGFDSCTISFIMTLLDVDYCSVDFCEAGRFSAFIKEDMKVYPCSFMANTIKGDSLINEGLLNIWMNSEQFTNVRKKILSNRCKDVCIKCKQCMGGCPVYEKINLC